jgi:hypothetical protein
MGITFQEIFKQFIVKLRPTDDIRAEEELTISFFIPNQAQIPYEI